MVARGSASPLGMLWPEMDAAFVTSGGENSRPPSGGRKRADLFCLGKIFDHENTSLIEYMITHTMY
jgi:hypothetical protein